MTLPSHRHGAEMSAVTGGSNRKKKITSIFDSVPKLSSEQESVAFRGVTLQPISTEALH